MNINYKQKIKDRISRKAEEPLLNVLEKHLNDSESVLEVGSGTKSPIGKIKRKFYAEGIDIMPINKDKKKWIHDSYKRGDIKNLRKYYKKKSFDSTIAIDVIEHLSKKDGHRLLIDMECISRKKVLIFTPNGFREQGAIDGNRYMRHLSGWSNSDFQKLGYKTYGIHGVKFLRGDQAGTKYEPWYFWLFVSHVSQYFVYFFPNLAFHLFAVKKIKS